MQLFYTLALLAAVISNSLLIVILARRVERTTGIVLFILLLILINAWAVPQLYIYLFHPQGELFVAIDKISSLGYCFICVVFIIFTFSYTQRLSVLRSYKLLSILFFPAIIFLYFAWNTGLIEARDPALIQNVYWGYRVPTGPLFGPLILWFEILTIAALYLIVKYYRSTIDVAKKRQSLWLIVALCIPLVVGTITNGILPFFNIPVIPLAIPLTSIMAAIIAYAVFRYELFELSSDAILTNLGEGVITIDQYGKIVQVNESAKNILSLSRSIDGKDFTRAVILVNGAKRQSPKKIPKMIRDVLVLGDGFKSTDFRMRTKRKKFIPVEFGVNPIFQKKKIVGATLMFRDITKEKELEKSKNEFIGIASHELKTPITAIKAFSQILEKRLKQSKDTKNVYFVSQINKQVNKITMLIRDLLDIDAIEGGHLVLKKNKCDLDEVIKGIIKDFQYLNQSHTIIKEGRLNKPVVLDEDRIQQVLINLVSNAIKYSPNADKVIISTEKANDEVLVKVRDFGIGVPKKDQKKIFGRYFRSRTRSRKNISGFGLGLYISSEIIKRHNGKIWVESIPGKGSTFSFLLPL